MSARLVEMAAVAAAAGVLLFTAEKRVGGAELPGLPSPAGRSFDAPAPLSVDEQGEPDAIEIEGAGTAEDPARVDFALFSFPDYDPPELRGADAEPLALDRFPPAVAGLAGSHVEMTGYMLAVDFVDGRLESFVFSRFPPGCCFGATPVFDEWLAAYPGPEGLEQESAYAPIAVTGVLEVGEAFDEEGFVTSLYRLRNVQVRQLR